MSYTKEQIASVLDYEVLGPLATLEDIRDAGAFCVKHKLHGLMVASVNLAVARWAFNNIIARIGGPHGNVSVRGKYFEATNALYEGADELNVVVNYGRFLGGNHTIINLELGQICKVAKKHKVPVTATLEAKHYAVTQLAVAAEQCVLAGVDCIQMGTHLFPTGHDAEILLKATRGTNVGVKIGQISCYDSVKYFLDSGVRRLGSSNFLELLP
jgi:deoxyribose-phosphate aldolase